MILFFVGFIIYFGGVVSVKFVKFFDKIYNLGMLDFYWFYGK